nr:MAG TPA: hypothetical protein [Inoviridae sp.]
MSSFFGCCFYSLKILKNAYCKFCNCKTYYEYGLVR